MKKQIECKSKDFYQRHEKELWPKSNKRAHRLSENFFDDVLHSNELQNHSFAWNQLTVLKLKKLKVKAFDFVKQVKFFIKLLTAEAILIITVHLLTFWTMKNIFILVKLY